MDIILKEDYQGLGYKNDVVSVKPGFGRNFLIPKGVAMMADDKNRKVLAENIKQAAHKTEKIKKDAQAIADKLATISLEIGAKVGESGKIFGSVTPLQISEALKNKGFNVDRRKVTIKEDIKEVGTFNATIDLHKEIQFNLTFTVVGE
ncbi:MAG: 50S ribosomal protein L9 [Bacteroidota bacterium]|nr:50S ribosomal protein L9 [Bacteroidota bacterium]